MSEQKLAWKELLEAMISPKGYYDQGEIYTLPENFRDAIQSALHGIDVRDKDAKDAKAREHNLNANLMFFSDRLYAARKACEEMRRRCEVAEGALVDLQSRFKKALEDEFARGRAEGKLVREEEEKLPTSGEYDPLYREDGAREESRRGI